MRFVVVIGPAHHDTMEREAMRQSRPGWFAPGVSLHPALGGYRELLHRLIRAVRQRQAVVVSLQLRPSIFPPW